MCDFEFIFKQKFPFRKQFCIVVFISCTARNSNGTRNEQYNTTMLVFYFVRKRDRHRERQAECHRQAEKSMELVGWSQLRFRSNAMLGQAANIHAAGHRHVVDDCHTCLANLQKVVH